MSLSIVHEFSMIDTPSRPYLKWLAMGIKLAEGRVNSQKYREILVGDSVVFRDKNSGRHIQGGVKFKHEYESFEQMLKLEGVKNLLPFLDDNDLEKGVEVYNAFPGAERVKSLGCVAIGMNITGFLL